MSRLTATFALFACLALAGTAQAADFTWSGGAPPGSPQWSNSSNWVGGAAPSGPIGTLTFPLLSGSQCSSTPPSATCYSSSNDLGSLSVTGISVDDGGRYGIGGSGITLGAGGITASTTASSPGNAQFLLPITLSADQTWSVDGNHEDAQIGFGAAISGSSTLSIRLSNQTALGLTQQSPMEVGGVSIVGGNTAGPAFTNGIIGMAGGADFNGRNQNLITLNHAGLVGGQGTNTIGPLNTTAASLQVGIGASPEGTLAVNGALNLDAQTQVTMFITGAGTTPGNDAAQLTAGPTSLGSAQLLLSDPGTCPSLPLGTVYTLISTSSSLRDTFAGLPDGATTQLACQGTEPNLRINYTSNSVTATVVNAPAGPTGPPTEGVTTNVFAEKGKVLIKLPPGSSTPKGLAGAAAGGFIPLSKAGATVPLGSTLDTTHGQVKLLTATNKHGGTQSGHFSKGLFIVQQPRTNPLTTVSMTGANLNSCSKLPHGGSRKGVVAAARRRSLFSNVHGRFRVRGRNSSASVRGTAFLVKDTCSGTLTSVSRGTVTVRDFTLRKNVTVKAHHKYLARAPKKTKR